jgi:imidazolonepropionase-like amidohydrolase
MKKLLLVTALALLPATAHAQSFAITNAIVCSGRAADGCKPGQSILVRDGKIVAVGSILSMPAGTSVTDAQGRHVTPGFIDGYSQIGTLEVEAVEETADGSAGKAEFSAAFDIQYALSATASAIPITRMNGVTRAAVVPGRNDHLFDGYGALVNLGKGRSMLDRGRAFQSLDMGEDGAARTGGSRADTIITIANALNEAAQYQANRSRYLAGGHREALTNRLDTEALIPVLNGEVPLLIKAQRASDIRAALSLRERFGKLRLVLAGVSEGWLVANEIAAAKVPVIIHALDNLPRDFESTAATMANAARLRRAGVQVALGSFDQQQNARLMGQYAANLTSLPGNDALSDAQALEAITAAPAAIFGFNAGVLEAGRAADIVIWDGPPLDLMSAPVALFINGQPVALESRQSKLRDRYLPIARKENRDLPVQYVK